MSGIEKTAVPGVAFAFGTLSINRAGSQAPISPKR